MVDHPTPSRTIVLTVLASLTAVSLVGCGKSPKEQARERNACGLIVRESANTIVTNADRVVPHFFVPGV